jgi:MoaA/NifB/PqqE/SkfB family radical SAM enzyme
MELKNISKTFCAAPFVHMYVHKNEDIKICCVTTENKLASASTELDLEKRWKSTYYQEIRQQFLDGEEPDICVACFTTEKHNGISDRMNYNLRYPDILEPNVETGNQYNSPIDLDIRPGNLCNLKCRMCGPHSSSQLDKEQKANPDLFNGFHPVIYDTKGVFSEKNINFLLKNVDKGEHIKFLGGEPTLMPEVRDILDKLIATNNTNVPIMITTNCTNITEQFMSKLKQFTRLSFNYSVDGTDKVVEYIRHPVKFNTIDNNIRLYKNIAEYDNISFVLQAYNLFNLYDTIKWAADIGVRVHVELLQFPSWCSVLCIPKEIRDEELYKMKELMLNEEYSEWITDPRTNILTTIDRILEDNREYPLHSLVRNTKRFDKVRDQHIKDYIPEVWEIIKEKYNELI